MKYAFAGDRQISCTILNMLRGKNLDPSALLVTKGSGSTHSAKLKENSGLGKEEILEGRQALKSEANLEWLKSLELDYIIGIHYPYIIPKALLELPKIGFLNLHPAYLPFNKGWHTPSWAILDKTPYGATLHFMAESLDAGDIIHQKKLEVKSFDTANTLYQKVLKLEEQVFEEALDDLIALSPDRKVQTEKGSSHKKRDLEKTRLFDLEDKLHIRDFLDKTRALTTNRSDELAYYEEDGKKIGVKIEFVELDK